MGKALGNFDWLADNSLDPCFPNLVTRKAWMSHQSVPQPWKASTQEHLNTIQTFRYVG